MKAGDELDFRYRLYWSAQPPVSTRWRAFWPPAPGWGLPEGWAPGEHYPDKWARRFAIDFVGGDLKAAAPRGIEPVIAPLQRGSRSRLEIPTSSRSMATGYFSTGIRPPTQPTGGGDASVPALSGRSHQRNLALSVFPAGSRVNGNYVDDDRIMK